jgi:hypothetical protein
MQCVARTRVPAATKTRCVTVHEAAKQEENKQAQRTCAVADDARLLWGNDDAVEELKLPASVHDNGGGGVAVTDSGRRV